MVKEKSMVEEVHGYESACRCTPSNVLRELRKFRIKIESALFLPPFFSNVKVVDLLFGNKGSFKQRALRIKAIIRYCCPVGTG